MQLDDRAEEEIAAIFASMEQRRATICAPKASQRLKSRCSRALGMRYLGQSWELVVDLPGAADNTGASAASGKAIAPVERILAAFADVHDRRFGHRSGGAVEIVSFRLAAVGRVAKPRLPLLSPDGAQIRRKERDARCSLRHPLPACAVYARDRLVLDEVVAGPAVIEESGSTTIVPPGWTARTMAHGELLMERSGHG